MWRLKRLKGVRLEANEANKSGDEGIRAESYSIAIVEN